MFDSNFAPLTTDSAFGFNSLGGFSFADLAKNTEGFAFGSKGWFHHCPTNCDISLWPVGVIRYLISRLLFSVSLFIDSNFSWANAGATVFGAAMSSAPKNNGEEDGSDEEEAPNNDDIHFEPIVSLPEVGCCPEFCLGIKQKSGDSGPQLFMFSVSLPGGD